MAILRGLNFFDVVFRSSDRMDTEFTSDFYFDFCRMSNIKIKLTAIGKILSVKFTTKKPQQENLKKLVDGVGLEPTTHWV